MLKLLIADDEEIVRTGIRNIIDWQRLGFFICAEASSGTDALQKIIDYQPDLVLLDMRMPGMTGIEVLEQLNSVSFSSKKPHVLILSGFSDFEYAQKALNFGAEGYMVKPVDEDILEEKVIRTAEKIKAEHEIDALRISALHTELTKNFSQMFLSGSVQPFAFNSQYDSSSFQVFIIQPAMYGCDCSPSRIENLINQYFSNAPHITVTADRDIILTLIDVPEESAHRYLTRLCTALADMRDSEEGAVSNRGAAAASGSKKKGIEGALESYTEAQELSRLLFFFDDRLYITAEDCAALRSAEPPPKNSSGLQSVLSRTGEFLSYIEVYDLQKIRRTLDDAARTITNEHLQPDEIKKHCMAFIVEMQNLLRSKYPEKTFETVPAIDLINILYDKKYFSEIIQQLEIFLTGLAESFTANTSQSTIVKVIQYIKSNYNADLKLEHLGQLFSVNSAYLGKKFKEHTGTPFNTYLDIIRIDAAKDMIKTTQLKIYQISQLSGYSNTDYFYMKFKKHTGMTPKQYKQMIEGRDITKDEDNE